VLPLLLLMFSCDATLMVSRPFSVRLAPLLTTNSGVPV
jgi:hypothetical protein